MNRHNFDEIFTLLENPTRRRILRLLSRETHYPLQIARELGISQQAVGKHIKILEDHGFVRSFEEPSSIGGPPRKSYEPTQRISIRVDLGPGVFQTHYTERKPMKRRAPSSSLHSTPTDRPPHPRVPTTTETASNETADHITDDTTTGAMKDTTNATTNDNFTRGGKGRGHPLGPNAERLRWISKNIREKNAELETLEEQRTGLINKREELMQEGRNIVMRTIPDYLERQLVYYLLERGPTSLEDMSEIFDRRIKLLRELQQQIEEEYGLRWLFRQ